MANPLEPQVTEVTRFETSDGTLFTDKDEAVEYERKYQLSRLIWDETNCNEALSLQLAHWLLSKFVLTLIVEPTSEDDRG